MNPAFMREALELARQGRAQASPNPMVGAVVVRDGEIVGCGFHTYAGVRHAEVLALAEAGERARNSTLYVSLEPCAHRGRTPPCVDAILAAGVAGVVAPIEDPNPLVSGQGFRRLAAAGVKIEMATEFAAEASKLNEAFLHFARTGRPLVTLKTALTLDGKITDPGLEAVTAAGWITSERARAHVQQLRHDHDAIVTGIGTVLADDCLLTDRTGLPRSRPLLRLVMDSTLRLPLDSRLAASAAGGVVIATTRAAPPERRQAAEDRGLQVTVLDGPQGRVDFAGLLDWLGRRQYLSLLIEAGSALNAAALASGLVDRIFFYYAPRISSSEAALPLAGSPAGEASGLGKLTAGVGVHGVVIHPIPPDEFAIEGYLNVHRDH